MTGAFVCFLDSYFLFFLFGLSNCLRIRGYLIKYPRIFHHVSVDISLRIHGYAKFLLCLCGLLVVYFCFFSYCCSYWLTRISRKTRRFLSSLDFWSHTDLTNLTDGASLRPRLSASPSVCAPDGTREWNDACFVRFVRSVWDKFIGPGFSRFSRSSREYS